MARFSGDFAVLLPQLVLRHRYCSEAAQRSLSSSSDKMSSGLFRRHLLNPGYRTAAVGCRHMLSFPSGASESVHWETQPCTEPSISGTTSSAELHNPRSEWHVGRHGRKAWLKDVAGRRGCYAWLEGVVGRRACRNRRIAARSFGVQLLTVALVMNEYSDEALVLIHSHATRRRSGLASSP